MSPIATRIAAQLRLALLLVLAGSIGLFASAGMAQARAAYSGHGSESVGLATSALVKLTDLPPEATHTLRLIQRGGPFPHPRKDGSNFGNFEKRLPLQTRGYYREYTVPTPGSRDRGARRIIAGSGPGNNVETSGEYYYTDDHYRSFRRIRE